MKLPARKNDRALPTRKSWLANSGTYRIGSGCTRDRKTNPASRIREAIRAVAVRAPPIPQSPSLCTIPSASDPTPDVSRATPVRSGALRAGCTRFAGRRGPTSARTTMPTGTLQKNAQRQPRASTRAPPTRGPNAAATPPAAPMAPTAVERRRLGKASSTSANEAGASMASPTAWRTRAAIRISTEGATATPALPARNRAKPIRKIRVLPKRSASHPPGTMTAAVVMANPVRAQEMVLSPASNDSVISPKATKIIEKLSVANATDPATSPKTRHGERVVVSAVTTDSYTLKAARNQSRALVPKPQREDVLVPSSSLI